MPHGSCDASPAWWRPAPMPRVLRLALLLVLLPGLAIPMWARGLRPPGGAEVPAADRARLEAHCAGLARILDGLEREPVRAGRDVRPLLPDVRVLHKAVDWALRFDGFQRTNDLAAADRVLALGFARAGELQAGSASWLTATGRVVRGFVSRIDGSVQPYGVVVPPEWTPECGPVRMDVWLHGRDERLTELRFLDERMRSDGEFAPRDAVVVHPYGRYCNAYKFAGETDVFEALGHASKSYGGDPGRYGIRGFSMGGAGVWHLAAHHPGFWRAAAPGAGFAETARYARIPPDAPVPRWERMLWQLYDAPVYAPGFHHLPVVAYSGELDPQRQAAQVMAAALEAEGIPLEHVIGPGVEHRYEPSAKAVVTGRFDALMAGSGPGPAVRVRFATPTLQYVPTGRLAWLRPERLERHWLPARMDAEVAEGGRTIRVSAERLGAFTLHDPPGVGRGPVTVAVNGQALRVIRPDPGTGWSASFRLESGRWSRVRPGSLRGKRPGIQGPIDHAFMERFLVVRPTGEAADPRVGRWTRAAMERFADDWRSQFRGELRIKDDVEVDPDDLASSNLILFGDPSSNAWIRRLGRRLPIRWTRAGIRIGGRWHREPEGFVSMIAPNPLNPDRYVVLNSGHTFADWTGTNARQTPRLPDWALRRADPGGDGPVLKAGFFDEDWRVADGMPGTR